MTPTKTDTQNAAAIANFQARLVNIGDREYRISDDAELSPEYCKHGVLEGCYVCNPNTNPPEPDEDR
jgi:hypothetical protein